VQLQQWSDGTNIYCYRGKCCRCWNSDDLQKTGPLILSCAHSSIVMAYILCEQCLCWLTKQARAEQLCTPSKPLKLMKEDLRGAKVLSEKAQFVWQADVGDLLAGSVLARTYSKCLWSDVAQQFARADRRTEHDAAAVRAHSIATACGDLRRRLFRGRAMRLRCVNEFPALGTCGSSAAVCIGSNCNLFMCTWQWC
jgi:hypothetical protein